MKHKFNCKPLSMLVASLTVADHFEAEKVTFVTEDPRFADPFVGEFRNLVNGVLQVNYGINTHGSLKQKTQALNELGTEAHADLKMVKTQIERGFRTVPAKVQSVLDQLGFTTYWSKATNNNQAILTSMLLAFRNNLNPELMVELLQNGVNPSRINRILATADILTQANITQETLKGTAKLNTEKTALVLNDIYDRTMDICTIGQELFQKNKLKKELFVFSKLVKQQSAAGTGTKPPDDNPKPTDEIN